MGGGQSEASGDAAEVPPALQRAADLVHRDLELDGALNATLSFQALDAADGYWEVAATDAESLTAFGVLIDPPWHIIVVGIADRMQDHYVESLWRACPRCPFHKHPLEPAVSAGEAIWRCPGGRRWSCPIGQLAEDPDYRAAFITR